VLDLGFVGEPETIIAGVPRRLRRSDIIPVIAPIGVGVNGETLNINADTVAGAVAAAVRASRLLLLTTWPGARPARRSWSARSAFAQRARMIADGTISGA